jgi:hypothetical protein
MWWTPGPSPCLGDICEASRPAAREQEQAEGFLTTAVGYCPYLKNGFVKCSG